MKNHVNKTLLATLACGAATSPMFASTDYGPAIWNPLPSYYSSGNGHRFLVIHDMEGWYGNAWSVFNGNGTSVHFAVNSGSGTSAYVGAPYNKTFTDSDGKPAGEISQFVRTAHYGKDARCWNLYHTGTEHEGFASNPAWFTEAQYVASASLQAHLCNVYGIPKTRNYIVGHGEESTAGWPAWASANLGIDPWCNTHTDPGPYWNWTHFMELINGAANNAAAVSLNYPTTVTVGQSFSATVTMNNNGGTHWVNANGYNLGSQNPADNTRWGMGRVGFAGTISPGQNGAFTFNCTAPTTAGSYAFDWKMVQDGVEWFGATAAGGITVNASGPVQVVVDNAAAGFTASASWVTATSAPDKYGSNYRYRSTAAVSDQATWTGSLPSAGSYGVYAWWTAGANRAANIGYTVYHATGSTTANVNQQANGGQWRLLTTASCNAGNNQVKLSCWTTTGFVVVADAILWQK